MPKNIIPKDNIPKIEEIRMIESDFNKSQQVRKIENQIPSYEEFLKDYQQEQLNYEDLTYTDIGSSKGFGPCSFANPNCTCYASQGYAPLRTACPANGCSNRSVEN
jgi:hypothetical protein